MANSANAIRVWPKVLLLGDSITQRGFSKQGCWASLLADDMARRCDVVQRGFSGYQTRWCKIILPSLLDKTLAKDVAAMTIFLGANDSCLFDLNPHQHVPLEEYQQNLKDMITYAMSVGISREKIIVITPPAFNPEAYGEECKEKGTVQSNDNKVMGDYAKRCREVGQEMGTRVVDLYTEMMKLEDFKEYLSDGLHFSEKGSEFLFSLLQPHFNELVNDKWILPSRDEVDLDNLEKSLSLSAEN